MLRFAPSPNGDININNLRVAIFNFLIASQKNKTFIVRIEDTDKQRNIEGKDTEIMQILEKFALTHSSVFHQSEHLNLHQTLAIKLLEQNKAFMCSCTPKEIEKEKEKAKVNNIPYSYSGKCTSLTKEEYEQIKTDKKPFVLRIKKPKDKIINNDLIKGDIKTSPKEVDSFIILKEDSTPAYNFACACDDMLSDISFIIREEKHLNNTNKQEHIKEQLGYKKDTIYAHIPIILNTKDKKDCDISIKWLFQEGFIPDAIINYLISIGSKTPKEIFSLPEAIKWFELENISKKHIEFDIDKLRFINREHIKLIQNRELSTLFGFADENIGKLAKVYLEEASTIKELEPKIKAIFTPKNFETEYKEQMIMLKSIIQNAPMIKDFTEFERYIIDKSGIKREKLFKPLRLLFTNAHNGPKLEDLYPHIKSYLLEIAS